MRRTLGLRSKVILTFFFAVLSCMIVLGAVCQIALRPLMVWDSRQQMENCLAEIEPIRAEEYEKESLEKICSEIYDKELISFAFFEKEEGGGDQQFFSSKYNSVNHKGNQKAFEEYLQAGMDPYVVERTDDANQIKRLYFIKKLDENHYVLMNKSIRGLDQLVRLITTFIMTSGIVIAVMGCVLWICLTRSFMMQVIRISQVTKNISELNFDQKLDFRGNDEIGVLAKSVDELSDKLKASIEGMQRELERRKTLIRNLTHELRTPLTTIQGYTENLQLALKKGQRENRFCEIILEECEAMDQLVKEMLELSRIEKGESVYTKEDFDIKEVFQNIRRQADTVFSQADISIRYASQEVCANRMLLERAITNYVKNAVQYGRPEGKIWVTGRITGDEYTIAVANEGGNLSPDDRERIWEAFYKTDKSRTRSGSYGIGLAIVQEIAHIHDARVDVSCEDGKTTFYFRMPVKNIFN
ncbi:MAG TPA: hypothetical protein DF613_15320 [Lachnospiraceae bacterium]|nr:hypothetical protein [Lachnospiraceae bacterium]